MGLSPCFSDVMMQPVAVKDCLSQSDVQSTSEVLSNMLMQEQTVYRCRGYLDSNPPPRGFITPKDRMKMVDWAYSIIDWCQFNREIVALTTSLADRFVSLDCNQEYLKDRRKYQLLFVSALYLVLKVEIRVGLSRKMVSRLSHGVYSLQDIEEMEWVILTSLQWCLIAPTPSLISFYMLSLVYPQVRVAESTWKFVLEEVRFQTEFAVRHYEFATQRPSTIALAAIINVLDVHDLEGKEILDGLICSIRRLDKKIEHARAISLVKDRLQVLLYHDTVGTSPYHAPVHKQNNAYSTSDTPRRDKNKQVHASSSPRQVYVVNSNSARGGVEVISDSSFI